MVLNINEVAEVAKDEEVLEISERLLKENEEVYKALAEGVK